MMTLLSSVSRFGLLAATPLFLIQAASAASDPIALPTGQMITPTAARGSVFQALNPHVASAPNYTVGQAVSTAVSPDGRTLLILTSGFNRVRLRLRYFKRSA